MQLENPQDHRNFFKILCTKGLQEANVSIQEYPIQDSLEFATIILDCIAQDPYEVTFDYLELSLLQSMQIVALAQISLADLPSIERLIKRATNIRKKYHKRIKFSGWDKKEVIRKLVNEDLTRK